MSKFCSSCGTELEDNENFCHSCGANQNSETTNNTNPQAETNTVNTAQPANPQAKSKVVAGLLGIFLGGWGIHNFYLGNTNRGIVQIIVSLVTCGIGSLWGFIEGIMILAGSINTDADGNPLVD